MIKLKRKNYLNYVEFLYFKTCFNIFLYFAIKVVDLIQGLIYFIHFYLFSKSKIIEFSFLFLNRWVHLHRNDALASKSTITSRVLKSWTDMEKVGDFGIEIRYRFGPQLAIVSE